MSGAGYPYRFFIVYQDRELWPDYQSADVSDEAFTKKLRTVLGRRFGIVRFEVVDRPSRRVGYPESAVLARLLEDPDHPMVIALAFATPEDRDQFEIKFKPGPISFAGLQLRPSGLNADVPISYADMPPFQHCCPGSPAPSLFGDRLATERLLRSDVLRSAAYRRSAQEAVSLVMVDQGLQHVRFPTANAAHGWPVDNRLPFASTGRHGSMVARNAIAFAPNATLFDCPLLPDRIADLQRFLSLGVAAYLNIILAILLFRGLEPRRSWVLVNAWGVYDRRLDQPPGSSSNYSHNPAHYFNWIVRLCTRLGIDVVFAAGNCGEFCPSTRCGPDDRGPGRSIYGANSLAEVLTAGAVRFDGTWLGYSSEGPGIAAMEANKPDVCAPSQFEEAHDSSLDGANSGTSGACGVAAGVVAGLRLRWSAADVGPEEIRHVLRRTAWLPSAHPNAKLRFGHGIIDVAEAVTVLAQP